MQTLRTRVQKSRSSSMAADVNGPDGLGQQRTLSKLFRQRTKKNRHQTPADSPLFDSPVLTGEQKDLVPGDQDGTSTRSSKTKAKFKSRFARLKNKPPSITVSSVSRVRLSNESRSSQHEHMSIVSPGSASISSQQRPFPMLRSQSSLSGKANPKYVREMSQEGTARRRTEGEIALANTWLVPTSLGGDFARQTPTTRSSQGSELRSSDEELVLPSLDSPGKYTPKEYAALLLSLGFGGRICALLAKERDPFFQLVMLAHVSQLSFVDEPLDIALRKFLLYVRLPTETQQTEKVLECFSEVYHEQNPWIFADSEQVYFVVFSMVILHTDAFNKSVRHKMTKSDYVRNAYCEGMPIEFFEYLYDNIVYTQFINADEAFEFALDPDHESGDENDLKLAIDSSSIPGTLDTSDYLNTIGTSATLMTPSTPSIRSRRNSSFTRIKDLNDPYAPILNGKIASLRPSFTSVLPVNDRFDSPNLGSLANFDAFLRQVNSGPTIELISQRSRPDAYSAESAEDLSHMNTGELLQVTSPGVVTIKAIKIGILFCRESSKKMLYPKTSWREWGAILTESQLYLFKNVSWVKSVMNTHDNCEHTVVRSALGEFSATTVLSTKDMAAILVKDHQTGQNWPFMLVGRGGTKTWFAASDESDMLDWMCKINYAAAFSTYHVSPLVEAGANESLGIRSSIEIPDSVNGNQRAAPPPPREHASVSQQRNARFDSLKRQLSEIARKMKSIDELMREHERNISHLRLLAPMQQKTRESLVFLAGQYSSKCEWCLLDRTRHKCYRDVLEAVLQLEGGLDKSQPSNGPATLGAESLSDSDSASLYSVPDVHGASFIRQEETGFEVNGHKFTVVTLNPDLARHVPAAENDG